MAATARAVDLTDVKEGGNFRPKRKPEGDYAAKIVKVEDHQPKDKTKSLGWVFTIQVDGDARSTYPYYVNPAPKEKWKIGVICRAAGLNVTGKRINFNPNKLVNKAVGIALEDDEYEGRPKSTIGDLFPVSEVGGNADEDAPDDEVDIDDVEDDEEVEEEEPPPAPKRRRKAAPAPVEEDEDDEEEEEPEPTPPPRKRAARRKPAPEPEPEDDEEEEEPPPPPRRTRAKKAAPPPPEDDDEDLDDLDTDELDD